MKSRIYLIQISNGTLHNDSCYAIDIIDECIRELDQDQEKLTGTIKLPSMLIIEDDSFKSMTPFMDDNLYE